MSLRLSAAPYPCPSTALDEAIHTGRTSGNLIALRTLGSPGIVYLVPSQQGLGALKALRDLTGLPGWILHRLLANYWLLAVSATVAAIPFALAILWLDRAGATDWLLANDLAPVATADTAKDFAGVAAGVNAAFIALYFSITLIVLSMAAGNLGVRLIDRWVERPLVRVSIAGLSFCLIVSLIGMLAIDGEADLSATPLALVGTILTLQAVNVAMLAVSLHDLARTMFVDTSIDRLARDCENRSLSLHGIEPFDEPLPHACYASREGYVEDVATDTLIEIYGDKAPAMIVHVAPGQHVLKGDLLVSSAVPLDEKIPNRITPIGAYRSDNQGVVFRIRLIVEIAARALSPAINDFYTALTSADKLAAIIESQAETYIAEGHAPALAEAHWLVLTGQDFRGLFEDPLSAFRQAACQYPSVSIRMIDNYARIARRQRENGAPDGLIEMLRRLAKDLCDHAASVAQFEKDRHDIRKALASGFPRAHPGCDQPFEGTE